MQPNPRPLFYTNIHGRPHHHGVQAIKQAPPPPSPTRIFSHRYWKNAKRKRATTKKDTQYTNQQLKDGVLNGSTPSAAYDTACTFNSGMLGDPFIQTTQQSTKVFSIANGRQNPRPNIPRLHHPVRKPAQTVERVPALAGQSFVSGVKFSEAGYISVCNGDEVNLSDSRTARIVVSEEAMLKGWFCPHTKMWLTPLQAKVTELKRHTLVLDGPNGTESLNPLYEVPSCARILKHIEVFKKDRPPPSEAINNVYELPSIEPAIRYLHGAAGFPTKATWIKAIRNGSYLSWPPVNIKMSTSTSKSQRKPKKGTCAPKYKDCDPPKTTDPPKAKLQMTQNPH